MYYTVPLEGYEKFQQVNPIREFLPSPTSVSIETINVLSIVGQARYPEIWVTLIYKGYTITDHPDSKDLLQLADRIRDRKLFANCQGVTHFMTDGKGLYLVPWNIAEYRKVRIMEKTPTTFWSSIEFPERSILDIIETKHKFGELERGCQIFGGVVVRNDDQGVTSVLNLEEEYRADGSIP